MGVRLHLWLLRNIPVMQTCGVEGAMRGPQIVMDDGGSAFMVKDVQTKTLRLDPGRVVCC